MASDIPLEIRVLDTIKEKKPNLRNEFDSVVAVLHLTMRELGFICTGLEEKASNNDDIDKQVFPEGWNKSSDSYHLLFNITNNNTINKLFDNIRYSFIYKHSQSTMTFILKFLLINDKLLVHGLSKEDNKVYSLELNVIEFVTEKAPLDNADALFKDLDKLTTLFKIHITSKLIPNLNKPGYEAEAPAQTQTQQQQQQSQQQQPRRDPLLADPPSHHPSYPRAPSYDPLRVPGSGRAPPFGVGYGDMGYPSPMPGFGIPGEMGGNLIGPGHPGFGPYVNDPFGNPNGGIGGPRLPRGAVPPGARFDPFGPPARGPGGGPGFPRGSGFPGGFSDPDNDELPPPGYNNMYL